MSRSVKLLTSCLALSAGSPVLAQSADDSDVARQIAILTQSLEAAKAQVAEVEKAIDALKARVPPGTVPEPKKAVQVATPEPTKAVQVADTQQIQNACPQGGIDQLAYIRAAGRCEEVIFAQSGVKLSKVRSVTGVGATVAAATSGSTATFSLRHSTIFRSLDTRPFEKNGGPVEQQRVWRQNFELGVRSDINKDDKTLATLATFGQLDRLASNVAVFAEFSRDYSASEPLQPTRGGSTWSFVDKRAETVMKDLSVKCRAAGGTDCESTGLVRWIFASRNGGFANPEAVKSYNEVFWGPPEVDKEPRFGWSVRGELSRPTFDYYPFALTKAPDPFNPRKSKTVIDPALFPQDFGSQVIKNEAHLNWALTGKAFFHVSTLRAKNYTSNHGPSRLLPYIDWETGTTFLVTASYVRKSEIQKPYRDVSICPVTPFTGAFTTNQSCTTLNIAGPKTTDRLVLGGEVRQGFAPFLFVPSTILSARYTHDFSTRENGLVVPLYFAEDDKGVFKSGLQFGRKWGGVNEDGSRRPAESVFGVVVGVAVSLNGTRN